MGFGKRNARILLAAACLIHLILAGGLVLTNLPLVDEGLYGIPAYTLATTGKLQNHVVEPAGVPYFTGIGSILYWMMPLGMVFQAAVFKVFGFSIFAQRALSLSCGLGTLLAWFFAVRKLLPEAVAAFSCLLLSFDFLFCSLSSRGRADMISLFFACVALAAYLNLRERYLTRALLLANVSCAISGLIHPNGGLAALASLIITISYLDRKRIGRREVYAAAAPYLISGLGLLAYIAIDPSLWIKQFVGNVLYRMPGGRFPIIRLITGEFSRYVSASDVTSLHDIRAFRLLIPVSYWAAAAGCLIFLRNCVPHLKWLLALLAGEVLCLVFFEGSKQGWYAVHTIPVLSTLLAVWLVFLWNKQRKAARALAVIQVLIAFLALLSNVVEIRREKYQRLYLPLIAFLNSHVYPRELVFGRTELDYKLKCRACLRDDMYLGAISRRRPDFIVLDQDYVALIEKIGTRDKSFLVYVRNLLERSGYVEVYRNKAYRVVEKRELAELTSPSASPRGSPWN